jgi:hypothetical protein
VQGCIGTVLNSHHVLIMLSSRNASGVLDSPLSATHAEIKQIGENEMSEKSASTHTVLHLRFKLRVTPDVMFAHSREAATIIASVEGLIWKIWVWRKEEFEMGGIYLFANRETAEAYLNHPVVQAVCRHPAVVSTQSQLWDVESSLSALTRAPLRDICVQHSEPDALVAGGQ